MAGQPQVAPGPGQQSPAPCGMVAVYVTRAAFLPGMMVFDFIVAAVLVPLGADSLAGPT